jgi:two-component system cell cycle response regulator
MSAATRRALIVERSHAQRSMLAALLRDAGADFVEAASLAAGLRKATEQRFDLICVAAKLRDGTGAQFCSALRATPEMAPIPVLVLMSDPEPDKVKALLDAGATEVLDVREIERVRQFFGTVLPPLPVLRGRALIVDEDVRAAEALLAVLRHLGLEADHVADTNSALLRVRKESIDLLIVGAMLEAPMPGAALIREVRALPGAEGRTPILAMASQTDPVRRIEVLRCGADDYIPKPVLAEELTVRVERLLRGKRREEESEAHRATFEALALTDPLTTLNNRRFLSEVAPMYLADARRHGFQLSVIVADLDQFDQITHTYEPSICEEVLRSVGRLLRRESRRGDVAVRCKDDEFVLLLPHCGMQEARLKAEALRSRIAALRPCGVGVTISAGVAQVQEAVAEGFAEVFARAGRAAQAAAQGGRNRVIAADA